MFRSNIFSSRMSFDSKGRREAAAFALGLPTRALALALGLAAALGTAAAAARGKANAAATAAGAIALNSLENGELKVASDQPSCHEPHSCHNLIPISIIAQATSRTTQVVHEGKSQNTTERKGHYVVGRYALRSKALTHTGIEVIVKDFLETSAHSAKCQNHQVYKGRNTALLSRAIIGIVLSAL